MMEHQSGSFGISILTGKYILFNIYTYFIKSPVLILSLTFLISVLVGFRLLSFKTSMVYPGLFRGSFVWFILELHKLTMVYLPTRYLVSFYISMGFLISVVLAEVISGKYEYKKKPVFNYRTLAFLIIGMLFILNLSTYFRTYQRRSFQIKELNEYFAGYKFGDRPVLGAWAPSLTWECKARALPVWNDFLNYQSPLATFHPPIVISEPDQEDSNQAYSSQGINLNQASDSVRTSHVGKWILNIYWISSLPVNN